jgi:hypothetical protein
VPPDTVGGVCTVLLRLTPGARWPLLLAAVRDEFTERAWDPPAAHWSGRPRVWGGRDRLAGGTWLAVDRARPTVGALLNGVRRDPPADGAARPTRGTLPLAALAHADGVVPGIADNTALSHYDGFHLLRANTERVDVWSWDGAELDRRTLPSGDHIVVNLGPDRTADPLIPHFMPLLHALPSPDPAPGLPPTEAWSGWIDLLRGDGLAPTDERGLIIRHEIADEDGVVHRYGSTSATLVGLRADGAVRYDFTATPATPRWYEVADAT